MTEAEFRDLVKRMRQAQRIYFKSRDGAALDVSKTLEREADAEIKAADDTQGKLFG